MTTIRAARVAEQLREQISDILQSHLRDPRLSWVSAMRVEVSPDLRHAKVFISVLGDEKAQDESLRAVVGATKAIRAELSRRLRIKRVPEIVFRLDHSIEHSLRIDKLLNEMDIPEEEPESLEPPTEESS